MFNSQYIAKIRAAHGKGFLSPTDTLSPATLSHLQMLAIDAGMSITQAERARPTDLIRIYSTACGSNFHLTPDVAQRMGELIDKRDGMAPIPPVSSPSEPMAPVPAPMPPSMDIDALAPILARLDAMQHAMTSQAAMIAAQEREIADLRASKPLTLEIIQPLAMEPVTIANAHPILPEVIDWLALGVNVFIYGPRGSGKTTMAEQVAKALDCKLYASGPIKNISRLIGYVNPFDGTYHATDFRKCFEYGGLFLADEIAAGDEEVLLELNMALANDYFAFPDGIVKKSKSFLFMGGDNTDGTGATDEYNGRSKLDDSFMDRFALIQMDYDETTEMAFAPHKSWAEHVQRFRALAMREGIRQPSPRATIFGGKWLNAGKSWDVAEARLLYRGMEETEANRMRSLMGTI